MDPDEALRVCLTQPGTAEGHDAAHALTEWLKRGGFAPAERIVAECGCTARRKLPHSHDKMYLERYENGWAITLRLDDGPTVYRRLRRD